MEQNICAFAGHAQIYDDVTVNTNLKNKIISLIENCGVTIFYNGGNVIIAGA